jgi:hypothetical protein
MRHDLKIGDRVKVTKDCTYSDKITVGMEGDVAGTAPLWVAFDCGTAWCFTEPSDGKVAPVTKAKKAPKGKQAYKGNGKHTWEPVTGCVVRLRVPGGWLYGKTIGGEPLAYMTFVPTPEVVGYKI